MPSCLKESREVLDLLGNKKILVLGLGISNLEVCRVLRELEIPFAAYDDSPEVAGSLKIKELVSSPGVFDVLFVSPSVKPTHPIIAEALRVGKNIYTDIDLFFLLHPNARAIGVTGTNGKSTLVSLLHHCFTVIGVDSALLGNIGVPILSNEQEREIYVIELSSFQLFYTTKARFIISIITNIEADHLNWHGNFNHYATAKCSIAKHSDTVLLGPTLASYEKQTRALTKCHLLDTEEPNEITRAILNRLECVVSDDMLSSFIPLEHRQELVAEVEGVHFINDSKATNPHATAYALSNFSSVSLIAGGQEKDTEYDLLLPHKERIAKVYIIGNPKNLKQFLVSNGIPHTNCDILQTAINQAYSERLSKTVLLSPAAASFDQFKSFEERGNLFRKIVREIVGG